MNQPGVDDHGRIYSALDKAASQGIENKFEDRIDQELRSDLAQEYGAPVLRREESGKISRVNAPYFAALFASKHDVLREIDEDRFYRYLAERGLWRRETSEENLVQIAQFMRAESEREEFQGLESRRCLRLDREIQAYLKGLPNVATRQAFFKEPDAPERIVHFENGVFLIRDGEPLGFRSEFRKEYRSRNQIPIRYDESATCPRTIEDFLLPALPEATAEDDLKLLFQFLGLFLLGVNLPQRLLILDGAAGSGKSTFSKLAGILVGRENVAQLRTRQLAERFELFAYVGKTLLVGPDVHPKFLLTPGAEVLKSLVGGDFLEAEPKAGNERPGFEGVFNVIVNTNADLRVKLSGDEGAWRRRLAIVHFEERKLTRSIPHFEKVLFREEAAGIANRALQGLAEVLDDGGRLSLTRAQLDRVEEMLDRSEPLLEFLRDRVHPVEGTALTKKNLREEFKAHCKERKWPLLSDREVGSRLPELMRELFDSDESNSIRGPKENGEMGNVKGYRNVSWRDD